MAHVYWSEKGEESVLAIARFIVEPTQSRQRGLDFVSKLEDECDRYSKFPLMGTSREDLGPGLRCFPVDSHLVVYRPYEDGIVVVLVAHGHQDICTVIEQIFGNGK